MEPRANPYHDEKGRFTSAGSNTLLPDIQIGRSVGAKFRNYDVLDMETGKHFQFVEGSIIKNVQIFAGKGTHSELRIAEKYAK